MTFSSAKGFTLNIDTGEKTPVPDGAKGIALAMLNADPATDLIKSLGQLSYNFQQLAETGQLPDVAFQVLWPMIEQCLTASGVTMEEYTRLGKLFKEMVDVMVREEKLN